MPDLPVNTEPTPNPAPEYATGSASSMPKAHRASGARTQLPESSRTGKGHAEERYDCTWPGCETAGFMRRCEWM